MIYTGKPEILVGKSNGSRHPVCRLDFRGRDSAYERGEDACRKRRPIWAWPNLFLTPKRDPPGLDYQPREGRKSSLSRLGSFRKHGL